MKHETIRSKCGFLASFFGCGAFLFACAASDAANSPEDFKAEAKTDMPVANSSNDAARTDMSAERSGTWMVHDPASPSALPIVLSADGSVRQTSVLPARFTEAVRWRLDTETGRLRLFDANGLTVWSAFEAEPGVFIGAMGSAGVFAITRPDTPRPGTYVDYQYRHLGPE